MKLKVEPNGLILCNPTKMRVDLSGRKFGKLLAISVVGKVREHLAWLCECDCGGKKIVASTKLVQGRVTHCGCSYKNGKITHNLYKSPLYVVWQSMRTRCKFKSHLSYKDYGGRGISVCPEWSNDFKKFYDDMIGGYRKGLTLDRIDNNGNYYKENCRWVTRKKQGSNRRNNRVVEIGGIKMCLTEASNYLGVTRGYLRYHIDTANRTIPQILSIIKNKLSNENR